MINNTPPVPGFRTQRNQPATDMVGALNQLNATLRGIKAILNERLPEAPVPDVTNDVY
jgi:hypothetical protein